MITRFARRILGSSAQRFVGFVGFAVFMTLVSCTPLSGLSPEGLAARGLQPGEGLIIGSYDAKTLSSSKPVPPFALRMAMLRAKRLDDSNQQRIDINSDWPTNGFNVLKPSLSSNETCFAVPVPEGSYEITGFLIDTYDMSATNRLPMKIPFQVRSGESIYIGKMTSIALLGTNLMKMPVFSGGVVIVEDQFEKDLPLITRHFPAVKQTRVRRSDVPILYLKEMKRISNTPSNWWD